ncbi:hypothetical protein O3P69_012393 [Scylla paramamosain]|uniref:Uncharacterized protein n=2 Tax=Scylla paramamosain TaxID=85552 RepID=A0AAW0SET6_SCYPA
MKKLLGDKYTSIDKELFLQLFYQRLPPDTQRCLFTVKNKLSIDELATLADEFMATLPQVKTDGGTEWEIGGIFLEELLCGCGAVQRSGTYWSNILAGNTSENVTSFACSVFTNICGMRFLVAFVGLLCVARAALSFHLPAAQSPLSLGLLAGDVAVDRGTSPRLMATDDGDSRMMRDASASDSASSSEESDDSSNSSSRMKGDTSEKADDSSNSSSRMTGDTSEEADDSSNSSSRMTGDTSEEADDSSNSTACYSGVVQDSTHHGLGVASSAFGVAQAETWRRLPQSAATTVTTRPRPTLVMALPKHDGRLALSSLVRFLQYV